MDIVENVLLLIMCGTVLLYFIISLIMYYLENLTKDIENKYLFPIRSSKGDIIDYVEIKEKDLIKAHEKFKQYKKI